MDENLVGYLMNSLDSETHAEVEDHLRDHPESRRRLDQLRRALEPLAADVEQPEPPPGLWLRTLAHVAEHQCQRLPAAPRNDVIPASTPSRSWWRRADLLIAASVMFLFAGIGVAWVMDARHRAQIDACANNLGRFHGAFSTYASLNGGFFPEVPATPPLNVAGVFVPMLHEKKLLDEQISVACPSNGNIRPANYTLDELRELAHDDPKKFEKVVHELGGCYAYSLGYRDGEKNHFPLHRDSGDDIPLMGDRPPFKAGDKPSPTGNSDNHKGKGQNVLHVGGAVKFLKERGAGKDDIYLNHGGVLGAGHDSFDAVLAPSWAKP